MSIYFAFSDENGEYKPEPGKNFLRSHPFYVRTTALIDGDEYKKLSNKFLYKKRKFDLPEDKEIKWSYLWSLRKHKLNSEEITEDKPYYFLKDVDYHELINYVEQQLQLLSQLDFIKIIISVTKNSRNLTFTETRMHEMHLEVLMQRIEMELQDDYSNLGIIFMDPQSDRKDASIRDAYFNLARYGNFIEKYKHIKDSLNFENSHHSIGIQMADYISGCTGAFLKSQTRDTYVRGKEMFANDIFPYLRRKGEQICGIGICEVPTETDFRDEIEHYLSEI